jgi:hypothetical protein
MLSAANLRPHVAIDSGFRLATLAVMATRGASRARIILVLLAALVLAWGTAWGERGRNSLRWDRVVKPGAPARVIRGLEGDRSLRLSVGPTIGQDRLAARRAFAALTTMRRKLVHVLALVEARFPADAAAQGRYRALTAASSPDPVDLETFAEEQAGWCRERSLLLAALLAEVAVEARVRYGTAFRPGGRSLGGHVWVEARIDGRWRLLDPLNYRTPRPLRTRILPVEAEDGRVGRRRFVVGSGGVLYLPTNDLFLGY